MKFPSSDATFCTTASSSLTFKEKNFLESFRLKVIFEVDELISINLLKNLITEGRVLNAHMELCGAGGSHLVHPEYLRHGVHVDEARLGFVLLLQECHYITLHFITLHNATFLCITLHYREYLLQLSVPPGLPPQSDHSEGHVGHQQGVTTDKYQILRRSKCQQTFGMNVFPKVHPMNVYTCTVVSSEYLSKE